MMVCLGMECGVKRLGKKICVNHLLHAVGMGSGATQMGTADKQRTTFQIEIPEQSLGLLRKHAVRFQIVGYVGLQTADIASSGVWPKLS